MGKRQRKGHSFFYLDRVLCFLSIKKARRERANIAKSHEIIAKDLDTAFPFANSRILTDGRKISYTINSDLIINADKSKQINIKSIIEAFCHKIDFGSDFNALRYWPLGKEKNIVVDPHHQLGQPTVNNTNILAETLYSMYTSGEKIGFISSLYNVSEDDVKASIELFKKAA